MAVRQFKMLVDNNNLWAVNILLCEDNYGRLQNFKAPHQSGVNIDRTQIGRACNLGAYILCT